MTISTNVHFLLNYFQIIPSYGNKELTFVFYPDQPCIFEPVSYNSFGLAYISLAEKVWSI